MTAGIILTLIGVLFVVLGWLIVKKEMISLFHDYHYDKVSPENKTAFCRLSGSGILVMGLAMVASGICIAITDSRYSLIMLAIGFVAGLAMLIVSGAKYNH